MRKRLFALVLAATAVLTFAACGDKSSNNSNSSAPSSAAQSSAPSSAAQSSTPSSSAEAPEASLADWVKSSDAKTVEDQVNAQLAGQGMTVKFAADGNVLVYEYYLEDNDAIDYSVLSKDDLDAAFGPVVEAYSSTLNTLFTSFESEYDIKLDAVRFTFYTADGSELYSGEVANK